MMGMKLGKRADASLTYANSSPCGSLGLCTDVSQDSDGAHEFIDANLDRHSLLVLAEACSHVACTCISWTRTDFGLTDDSDNV
jgi:hypothetical protein